jgi:hypothetical protein
MPEQSGKDASSTQFHARNEWERYKILTNKTRKYQNPSNKFMFNFEPIKSHSKRVEKMKPHSKRVEKVENHTQNEWKRLKTTPKTSGEVLDIYGQVISFTPQLSQVPLLPPQASPIVQAE